MLIPKMKIKTNYPTNDTLSKDMRRFEKLCIKYLFKIHTKFFAFKELSCECTHSDIPFGVDILYIDFFDISDKANIEILTDTPAYKPREKKAFAQARIFLSADAMLEERINYIKSSVDISFVIQDADIYFLSIPNRIIDDFTKQSTNTELDSPLIEWLEKVKSTEHEYTYLGMFLSQKIPLCPLTHRIFPDLFGIALCEYGNATLSTLIKDAHIQLDDQNNIMIETDFMLNLLSSIKEKCDLKFILPDPEYDEIFHKELLSIASSYLNSLDDETCLDQAIGDDFKYYGSVSVPLFAFELEEDVSEIADLFDRIEISTNDGELFYTIDELL